MDNCHLVSHFKLIALQDSFHHVHSITSIPPANSIPSENHSKIRQIPENIFPKKGASFFLRKQLTKKQKPHILPKPPNSPSTDLVIPYLAIDNSPHPMPLSRSFHIRITSYPVQSPFRILLHICKMPKLSGSSYYSVKAETFSISRPYLLTLRLRSREGTRRRDGPSDLRR